MGVSGLSVPPPLCRRGRADVQRVCPAKVACARGGAGLGAARRPALSARVPVAVARESRFHSPSLPVLFPASASSLAPPAPSLLFTCSRALALPPFSLLLAPSRSLVLPSRAPRARSLLLSPVLNPCVHDFRRFLSLTLFPSLLLLSLPLAPLSLVSLPSRSSCSPLAPLSALDLLHLCSAHASRSSHCP